MFLNSAAKVMEYCKDQPILREVSQQRFLRAKTMSRSYRHVTRDLVEAGSKAKHAKREVERLVGKIQYYFLILKQSNYVRRAIEMSSVNLVCDNTICEELKIKTKLLFHFRCVQNKAGLEYWS